MRKGGVGVGIWGARGGDAGGCNYNIIYSKGAGAGVGYGERAGGVGGVLGIMHGRSHALAFL